MSTVPFSFWLVPAEPFRIELALQIDRLCGEFCAPRFAPHVTLFVGEHPSLEGLMQLGGQLALGQPPLTLTVADIDFSDFLFKTLYIQFEANQAATMLFERARASLPEPGAYQFDPHLSLIYKKMETAVQKSVAASIVLSSNIISFDQLSLMMPKHGAWDDIAGWQTVQNWSFG